MNETSCEGDARLGGSFSGLVNDASRSAHINVKTNEEKNDVVSRQ